MGHILLSRNFWRVLRDRFVGRFAREKVFSTTRNIVAVFTEETHDTVVETRATRATNRNYDFRGVKLSFVVLSRRFLFP